MMQYELPYVNVVKFSVMDVITTSTGEDDDEAPPIPPGANCI